MINRATTVIIGEYKACSSDFVTGGLAHPRKSFSTNNRSVWTSWLISMRSAEAHESTKAVLADRHGYIDLLKVEIAALENRLADERCNLSRKVEEKMDTFREYTEALHLLDDSRAKRNETDAENDRLRRLLAKDVEGSPIHSVTVESGSVDIAMSPPHWAMKAMAASFAETLAGAPNWCLIEVGPIPSCEGMLIVTVRRKSGDSPVETVGKLKDAIEDLISEIQHVYPHELRSVNFARALLNPDKKD